MATYNGARYLPAQLQSFLDQTRCPDELVITDDQSSDETAEVVAEFARRAPFPVLFHRNDVRLGIHDNFARASQICSGQIILFSDQDDVWLPPHVQCIVAPMEADPAVGLVVTNSTYVDAELKPDGSDLWSASRFTAADHRRCHKGHQFPHWARHHVVAGHAMGFRASLRRIILPFSHRWMYDHWIAMLGVAFTRGLCLDQRVTLHRHHASQFVGHSLVELKDQTSLAPNLSSDHFATEIAKWQDLRDRLRMHASDLLEPSDLEFVDRRLSLLQARRLMRTGGAGKRILGATIQFLLGNYHRFGRGMLTYARDLAG